MYMRHTMHATVYCKQEQVYSFTVVCRYFVTLSQIPQGWYPYSKAKLTLHLSHSQANFWNRPGNEANFACDIPAYW